MRPVHALSAGLILIVGAGAAAYTVFPRQPERRLLPEPTRPAMYVALGDSTVYGVGATDPASTYVSGLYERLRSRYPEARLVNLGVSGATAADVLAEQLPRAVELHPDLVTLSVGPNDITQRRDVSQYERDVETILKTLARRTGAVVVLNLIPDLAVTPRFRGSGGEAQVGQQVRLFNEALARQARAYGAEVVDLYGPSREELPRHPELIAADGYHPSDRGYARWAELMWRGVEARLPP